jgi:hypothetical protein
MERVMESQWSQMTDEQRAEFSAWRLMKQQQADAKVQAEAEAAAATKRYEAMTENEKRAWLDGHGLRVPHGSKP